MRIEYKSVTYKGMDAPNLDIQYINDLLHDACIWGRMKEYLNKDSLHEKDKNITREVRHLDYFCDIDAYIICLLLLKREYSSSHIGQSHYSWTELSREIFSKNDTRRVQKIVEAGEHFGMLSLSHDKNKISRVVPTDNLRTYFRKYIYPNIRYCA